MGVIIWRKEDEPQNSIQWVKFWRGEGDPGYLSSKYKIPPDASVYITDDITHKHWLKHLFTNIYDWQEINECLNGEVSICCHATHGPIGYTIKGFRDILTLMKSSYLFIHFDHCGCWWVCSEDKKYTGRKVVRNPYYVMPGDMSDYFPVILAAATAYLNGNGLNLYYKNLYKYDEKIKKIEKMRPEDSSAKTTPA